MSTTPNILLVITHDIGDRLGCSGYRDVCSPRLDAVAAAGARCVNAFCTQAQCSPGRASLTTGRHPCANGVMGLTHRDFGWDLHDDEVHLVAWLREHGYRTTGIGTIHETQRPHFFGFERHHRADIGPYADANVDAAIAELNAAREDGRPWYLQLGLFEGHRQPNCTAGPFGPMPSDRLRTQSFHLFSSTRPMLSARSRRRMAQFTLWTLTWAGCLTTSMSSG